MSASLPALSMEVTTTEVSIKGKRIKFPALRFRGREIVVTGKMLKIAAIKDAEWVEGKLVDDIGLFVSALKDSQCRSDIFTFAQELEETQSKYPYRIEWDNVAAVPITTYSDWWENRLTQVSRKNVRRSQKRGVLVKVVPFDDELIRGIMRIYNETPIRQGRRFWHYGKDFDTVKQDNSSYADRSVFVGAYFQDELIGFIKIVFVGKIARIMQILSLNQHFDKRPPNALLAKAVEVCCERGASHFIYGKYIYDNKADSPVTEFKRRNGFEEIRIPTYYSPLRLQGRLALMCKLHLRLKQELPEKLVDLLLRVRSKFNEKADANGNPSEKSNGTDRNEKAEE